MLRVAVQIRSILELFAASFAGAPRTPRRAHLLELAQLTVADQMRALSVPAAVVDALAVGDALAPMLTQSLEQFGVT